MRTDIAKFSNDRQRSVEVLLWPSTTDFVEIMNRTATGEFDLAPFITQGSHTSRDANLTVTWDGTGSFLANQPEAGDVLEIRDGSVQLWIGFIDEINNYNEERGNRVLRITARVRDAVGPWRKRRYVSPRFQAGASLAGVAQEVLINQGLTANEYDIPLVGFTVPHPNVQFADLTPWKALQLIGLAIGYEPYTNARGQISYYSRAVDRPADIVLTNEDVVRITGGKGKAALTAFRLLWLDRNLTKVVQQDQVLGTESITAGFFKRKTTRKVYWSDDRRARAQNTKLKVLDSINAGIINVGDENYVQVDRFHGKITTEVDVFVASLATASLAAVLLLDAAPDGVVTAGLFGVGAGYTVPKGRVIRGIAEAALLLIMMSIGTGNYEIWGEPYDFVHAVNTTEAFNENAPVWMEDVQAEENDLIFDEEHAQEVVVRELLHRVAESNKWDTVITDDPRIEPGDILELPDTSRLYVEDYTRQLTRGSPSQLSVSGFRS
jgi:hypothetical protein